MKNKRETQTGGSGVSATERPKNLRLQIALRAYHLWLIDGGRHDNRLIHWLRAERELMHGCPAH
jgi:hypothetical protein